MPIPYLFIRAFLYKEAVLSSRIEGTQVSLGELFAANAGAKVERSAEELEEVANYIVALDYGIDRLATLPLSLRLVRELHERLMRGVRGETATPGQFRRIQNWIGPPGCGGSNATYVPPPPDELMDCLGAWERFLHDESLPPLVHAALIHSQFEAIHPFLDGNGRMGRLLFPLLFAARGVLPTPLLYLSAYFESTRQEYYEHLLRVTHDGEWEAWLVYFLRGVAEQAEDAIRRIRRIDELFHRWSEQIAGARSGNLGDGFGTVRRIPVLERPHARIKAGGRLHDGSARRRSVGISRYCHAGWRRKAKPCILCGRSTRSPRRAANRKSRRTESHNDFASRIMSPVISEKAFEDAIEAALLGHGKDESGGLPTGVREGGLPIGGQGMEPGGYFKRRHEDYDRALCLLPRDVLDFIIATQPKEWRKLSQHYGAEVRQRFLRRLSSEIERRGALHVLRNGIKDMGCTFRLAYFRPASGLNEETRRLYMANFFAVGRQVRYSTKNENSLDLVLFLNGIPIFTAELKNLLSGQTVEDAIRQYKTDREPARAAVRLWPMSGAFRGRSGSGLRHHPSRRSQNALPSL